MDDNSITAIVGWPTEPEMVNYRAVANAAITAEREACAAACAAVANNDVPMHGRDTGSEQRKLGATLCRNNIIKRSNVRVNRTRGAQRPEGPSRWAG